ncbi:hypothetical protein ROZALSC1DRAFT_25427 [Rozella allomycis CSF55]|uniref:Uncharacterized protein n=1 Tax=Rozella allomycis (strain CSF55) TaxID=988480 RepID=A0A4P9YAT0_ROZAC|nr:hypothetical protein ROZALSC1DRAFT_25427 [Rozella allomycis CSF55]
MSGVLVVSPRPINYSLHSIIIGHGQEFWGMREEAYFMTLTSRLSKSSKAVIDFDGRRTYLLVARKASAALKITDLSMKTISLALEVIYIACKIRPKVWPKYRDHKSLEALHSFLFSLTGGVELHKLILDAVFKGYAFVSKSWMEITFIAVNNLEYCFIRYSGNSEIMYPG